MSRRSPFAHLLTGLPSGHPPDEPTPRLLVDALACLRIEHRGGRVRRLAEPARALTTVAAHGVQRATAPRLDDFGRRIELAHEPARRSHGRFDGLADFVRAQGTALDPGDDQLANRQADTAHRYPGVQQAGELGGHYLLERAHDADSTRSASPTTSMRTVPPSLSLPATMRRATGVSTSRWMARLSGRAPKTGS